MKTKIGVLVSLVVIQLITAASLQAQELKLGEPWYLRKQAYGIFLGILRHFGVDESGILRVVIDSSNDPFKNLRYSSGSMLAMTSKPRSWIKPQTKASS